MVMWRFRGRGLRRFRMGWPRWMVIGCGFERGMVLRSGGFRSIVYLTCTSQRAIER